MFRDKGYRAQNASAQKVSTTNVSATNRLSRQNLPGQNVSGQNLSADKRIGRITVSTVQKYLGHYYSRYNFKVYQRDETYQQHIGGNGTFYGI
jgi:hypothetical protein